VGFRKRKGTRTGGGKLVKNTTGTKGYHTWENTLNQAGVHMKKMKEANRKKRVIIHPNQRNMSPGIEVYIFTTGKRGRTGGKT